MTYERADQRIDPTSRLAAGDVEEWLTLSSRRAEDVTPDQAERINDLIREWARANPDGHGDMAARALDRAVLAVLAEPERDASEDVVDW
jgi:hypothetical protein